MPPKKRKRAAVAKKTSDEPSTSVRILKTLKIIQYHWLIRENFQSAKKAKVSTTPEKSTSTKSLRIAVDHCTSWSVFKRKANEIFQELSELIPDKHFELSLNADGKPKRGKICPTERIQQVSDDCFSIFFRIFWNLRCQCRNWEENSNMERSRQRSAS